MLSLTPRTSPRGRGGGGGSPNYRLHFAAKIELYVAGACICVWLGLFFFGIIVSEVL